MEKERGRENGASAILLVKLSLVCGFDRQLDHFAFVAE
jgi:hypothetical protein